MTRRFYYRRFTTRTRDTISFAEQRPNKSPRPRTTEYKPILDVHNRTGQHTSNDADVFVNVRRVKTVLTNRFIVFVGKSDEYIIGFYLLRTTVLGYWAAENRRVWSPRA